MCENIFKFLKNNSEWQAIFKWPEAVPFSGKFPVLIFVLLFQARAVDKAIH